MHTDAELSCGGVFIGCITSRRTNLFVLKYRMVVLKLYFGSTTDNLRINVKLLTCLPLNRVLLVWGLTLLGSSEDFIDSRIFFSVLFSGDVLEPLIGHLAVADMFNNVTAFQAAEGGMKPRQMETQLAGNTALNHYTSQKIA
eukprot:2258544-Amphidinium_carterae.1